MLLSAAVIKKNMLIFQHRIHIEKNNSKYHHSTPLRNGGQICQVGEGGGNAFSGHTKEKMGSDH